MPILPFIPEPIEQLKARFPICLVKIWNPKNINAGGKRPGQSRDYVFDFESGLRLLISKTAFFPHDISVHISASWEHDVPLTVNTINELSKDIQNSFHSIRGNWQNSFHWYVFTIYSSLVGG